MPNCAEGSYLKDKEKRRSHACMCVCLRVKHVCQHVCDLQRGLTRDSKKLKQDSHLRTFIGSLSTASYSLNEALSAGVASKSALSMECAAAPGTGQKVAFSAASQMGLPPSALASFCRSAGWRRRHHSLWPGLCEMDDKLL